MLAVTSSTSLASVLLKYPSHTQPGKGPGTTGPATLKVKGPRRKLPASGRRVGVYFARCVNTRISNTVGVPVYILLAQRK